MRISAQKHGFARNNNNMRYFALDLIQSLVSPDKIINLPMKVRKREKKSIMVLEVFKDMV